MFKYTKTHHQEPYPAIDPTRPELSQAGRTLLITGGGTGIGLATCRAFVAAGVSRIVLTARRVEVLEEARAGLLAGVAEGKEKPEILVEGNDMNDAAQTAALWDRLAARGIAIDVLCLNAAATNFIPSLWENDEDAWTMFETNVRANLRIVKRFLKQGPAKGKALLNVSSAAVHLSPAIPMQGPYNSSKNAFTATLQWIADEVDRSDTRILSFHPGAILTPAARNVGATEDTFPWDSENLPGQFAVWAASPEADFLHGRFVWAHWDVEELKAERGTIEANAGWLRMGLQGPEPMDGTEMVKKFSQALGK